MGRKKVQDTVMEEIYEIKSILKYEKRRGKDYYLVEWEGYPISEATWEPRSNFIDVSPEILAKLNDLKEIVHNPKKPSEKQRRYKNEKKPASETQAEVKRHSRPSVETEHSQIKGSLLKSSYDIASDTQLAASLASETTLSVQNDSHYLNRENKEINDIKDFAENSEAVKVGSESAAKKRKKKVKESSAKLEDPGTEITQMSPLQIPHDLSVISAQLSSDTVLTGASKGHKRKRVISASSHKGRKDQKPYAAIGKPKKENLSKQLALGGPSSYPAPSPKFPISMDSNDAVQSQNGSFPHHQESVNEENVFGGNANLKKDLVDKEGVHNAPPSIRVKSLRQDVVHGLCGIITTTLSTGIVEESRMPISDVRVQYPDELIEFLLQRIQFRSVRPASINNSLPMPPLTTV